MNLIEQAYNLQHMIGKGINDSSSEVIEDGKYLLRGIASWDIWFNHFEQSAFSQRIS